VHIIATNTDQDAVGLEAQDDGGEFYRGAILVGVQVVHLITCIHAAKIIIFQIQIVSLPKG